jgi:two-component system OmpR family sensor kinase
VSCDAPETLPIRARADDLLRAFDNVVRNALRFAPAGSTIDIALQVSGDGRKAIFTVDDKGPGLRPEEIDSVFRPFVRAEAGNGGTGFGLGLAIAERAVRAHDGRIEASNRSGGGLRIAITLPLTS